MAMPKLPNFRTKKGISQARIKKVVYQPATNRFTVQLKGSSTQKRTSRWKTDAAKITNAVMGEWRGNRRSERLRARQSIAIIVHNHPRVLEITRKVKSQDPSLTWTDAFRKAELLEFRRVHYKETHDF